MAQASQKPDSFIPQCASINTEICATFLVEYEINALSISDFAPNHALKQMSFPCAFRNLYMSSRKL